MARNGKSGRVHKTGADKISSQLMNSIMSLKLSEDLENVRKEVGNVKTFVK